MTKLKNVVIISRNNFPENDAGSVRDRFFAKIYKSLDYNVSMICLSNINEGIFEGVKFYSIRITKKNLIDRLKSEFGFRNRMVKILNIVTNKFQDVDIVHIVDIPLTAVALLKKLSEKFSFQLIHDSVEWYSPSNFKTGLLHPGFIHKELLNRLFISKPIKVISISTFLGNHFRKRGLKSIVIPVIMDSVGFHSEADISDNSHEYPNRLIRLVYAGSPARKDIMAPFFVAFQQYCMLGNQNIEVHIAGIDEFEYKKMMERQENFNLDYSSSLLHFYGRISRNDVLNLYKNMDFSLLFRDSQLRYSKAGFPTKVVESLFCGVPVLCNLSSDLGDYLLHNFNSFVVKELRIQDILESLTTIGKKSKFELKQMKINSIVTAIKFFQYSNYSNQLEELIKL